MTTKHKERNDEEEKMESPWSASTPSAVAFEFASGENVFSIVRFGIETVDVFCQKLTVAKPMVKTIAAIVPIIIFFIITPVLLWIIVC